mmetsp:Transcript_86355/g.279615  ORF Transcript_86355/g.279615 Transcript_86355/m.279615 type:complete len:423 (+) Transcript_86355:610-1878(+)
MPTPSVLPEPPPPLLSDSMVALLLVLLPASSVDVLMELTWLISPSPPEFSATSEDVHALVPPDLDIEPRLCMVLTLCSLDRCEWFLLRPLPFFLPCATDMSPKPSILLDCQFSIFFSSVVSRRNSSFRAHLSSCCWQVRSSYFVERFSISSAWCLRQCSWSSIVSCIFPKWSTNSLSFRVTLCCRVSTTPDTLLMLLESVPSILRISLRLGRASNSDLNSDATCFMRMPASTAVFCAPLTSRLRSSFCFSMSAWITACESLMTVTSAFTGSTRFFRTKSSILACESEICPSGPVSVFVSSIWVLWISVLVKPFMRPSSSLISVAVAWSLSCTCSCSSAKFDLLVATLSVTSALSFSRCSSTFVCKSSVTSFTRWAWVCTEACASSCFFSRSKTFSISGACLWKTASDSLEVSSCSASRSPLC